MYKSSYSKEGYNPLDNESDDILGLYESQLDTPLSETLLEEVNDDNDDNNKRVVKRNEEYLNDSICSSSVDGNRVKSEKSDVRESVAWFKRPIDPEAIPESMNFDEVESIMWRKVRRGRCFPVLLLLLLLLLLLWEEIIPSLTLFSSS